MWQKILPAGFFNMAKFGRYIKIPVVVKVCLLAVYGKKNSVSMNVFNYLLPHPLWWTLFNFANENTVGKYHLLSCKVLEI